MTLSSEALKALAQTDLRSGRTMLKPQVTEVRAVMTNNIDQVLNRGEKLDNLVTKSEQLGDQVRAGVQCLQQRNFFCCFVS